MGANLPEPRFSTTKIQSSSTSENNLDQQATTILTPPLSPEGLRRLLASCYRAPRAVVIFLIEGHDIFPFDMGTNCLLFPHLLSGWTSMTECLHRYCMVSHLHILEGC